MNIGNYRHRITFQASTLTSDGQGGQTAVLSNLATQWASVVPLSGDRLLRMQQIILGQWYSIETNYRKDLAATIDEGNPILFNGRTLVVKSYQNEGEEGMTWKMLAYEKRN